MEKKESDKIATILVGGGIDNGDSFVVAGRASSVGEARRKCREPDFIRKHIGGRRDGAYVLIVSCSGHNVFLPLRSVLGKGEDG